MQGLTPGKKREYFPFQPNWEIDTIFYCQQREKLENSSDYLLYYEFELSEEISNRLAAIPDGCVDIIFTYGSTAPEAKIFGSVLTTIFTPFESGIRYFGVRIPPAYHFISPSIRIGELIGHNVDLIDIYPNGKEIIEKMQTKTNFQSRINCFQKFFLPTLISYQKTDRLMDFTLRKIAATGGQLSVQLLAAETGYSSRYIRDKYIANIGISPKKYSDIVRFQSALKMLMKQEDIFSVIVDNGYYDQAHIINSFTKFHYLTPLEFTTYLKYKKIERITEI